MVRFLVPSYVQDDPSLARVIDESLADRVADKLAGRRSQSCCRRAAGAAGGQSRRHRARGRRDHGRLRCPLVAVMKDKEIIGAITASRLLELVVAPTLTGVGR